jgi:hypothetical protein
MSRGRGSLCSTASLAAAAASRSAARCRCATVEPAGVNGRRENPQNETQDESANAARLAVVKTPAGDLAQVALRHASHRAIAARSVPVARRRSATLARDFREAGSQRGRGGRGGSRSLSGCVRLLLALADLPTRPRAAAGGGRDRHSRSARDNQTQHRHNAPATLTPTQRAAVVPAPPPNAPPGPNVV